MGGCVLGRGGYVTTPPLPEEDETDMVPIIAGAVGGAVRCSSQARFPPPPVPHPLTPLCGHTQVGVLVLVGVLYCISKGSRSESPAPPPPTQPSIRPQEQFSGLAMGVALQPTGGFDPITGQPLAPAPKFDELSGSAGAAASSSTQLTLIQAAEILKRELRLEGSLKDVVQEAAAQLGIKPGLPLTELAQQCLRELRPGMKRFDPNTGLPIAAGPRFDPNTGAPLDRVTGLPMDKYDAETGKQNW